jgi:hypothetical protein
MVRKLRNRIQALKLVWLALTCESDKPAAPGHFRTHNAARGYLADARGMWRNA